MKIGIIAGNRLLPIILAQNIKQQIKDCEITAICFKGETLSAISRFADKTFWIKVGQLQSLTTIIESQGLSELIMAGQISPLRIFQPKEWDQEMCDLVKSASDFRPHNIFSSIIKHLEAKGARFLDSTLYLKDLLADKGMMNGLGLNAHLAADIDFGLNVINRFVELDIGQTMVVKDKTVVATESIEGTDKTILRAGRLAGKSCLVLKFAKLAQDLRFDIPVVGLSTLDLLKKIKASGLILEASKVIILEKDKFLDASKRLNIPVLGR